MTVVVFYCIGSWWGIPSTARPDLEIEHHWTEDKKAGDWVSDCGQERAKGNDRFHGILTATIRHECDKTKVRLCPECVRIYPTTPIGKLLRGERIEPQ